MLAVGDGAHLGTGLSSGDVRNGGIGSPVFLVCQAASGQLVNIEVSNNAAYGYDVRGDLVCKNGTELLPVLRPRGTGIFRGLGSFGS